MGVEVLLCRDAASSRVGVQSIVWGCAVLVNIGELAVARWLTRQAFCSSLFKALELACVCAEKQEE